MRWMDFARCRDYGIPVRGPSIKYACALSASWVLSHSVPRPHGYAGHGIARGVAAGQNGRGSRILKNCAARLEKVTEVKGNWSNRDRCDEILKVCFFDSIAWFDCAVWCLQTEVWRRPLTFGTISVRNLPTASQVRLSKPQCDKSRHKTRYF
jgi:hypothetical protein